MFRAQSGQAREGIEQNLGAIGGDRYQKIGLLRLAQDPVGRFAITAKGQRREIPKAIVPPVKGPR